MSWAAKVTEQMLEMKRCGIGFEDAWSVATTRHKFQAREFGIRSTDTECQNLFEQPEYEMFEWFRGVCRAAYLDLPAPDGSPSKMRGLRAALDGGFLSDGSQNARKVTGRMRAAA